MTDYLATVHVLVEATSTCDAIDTIPHVLSDQLAVIEWGFRNETGRWRYPVPVAIGAYEARDLACLTEEACQ